MPDQTEIAALLRQTLTRLQAFGVRHAVLFTGHFADEQLAMIATLANDWNAAGGPLRALALGVNGNPDAPLPPDHAGRFETTLLAAYQPQAVDLSQLPPPRPDEAGEDPYGAQRHAPDHSLHGIFGPDPRGYIAGEAAGLRHTMAAWLAASAGPL
jgi:creatinine amidohydrolase